MNKKAFCHNSLCAANTRTKNYISTASLEITWKASRSTWHRTNTNIDRLYFWNNERGEGSVWMRLFLSSHCLMCFDWAGKSVAKMRSKLANRCDITMKPYYVRNPQAIRQKESLGENGNTNAAWPQSLHVNQKWMRETRTKETKTKEDTHNTLNRVQGTQYKVNEMCRRSTLLHAAISLMIMKMTMTMTTTDDGSLHCVYVELSAFQFIKWKWRAIRIRKRNRLKSNAVMAHNSKKGIETIFHLCWVCLCHAFDVSRCE